jgi:hypothetical protein
MSAMTDEPTSGWRINKEIPLSLIVAIFVQTLAIFGWGITISNKVDNHQKYIDNNELYKEKVDTNNEAMKERLIKLEDRTSTELEMLQRMDAVIEQQPTRKTK